MIGKLEKLSCISEGESFCKIILTVTFSTDEDLLLVFKM